MTATEVDPAWEARWLLADGVAAASAVHAHRGGAVELDRRRHRKHRD